MALTDEELRRYLGEQDPARVERVDWPDHFAFLEDHWAAGQHASIFAATDGGKTHLWRSFMPLWLRYPVLVIQVKPRDDTLAGWPGRKVSRFPSWQERLRYNVRRRSGRDETEAWLKDPEWFVLQLPPYRWSPAGQHPTFKLARRIAGEAIDQVYQEGTWVLIYDEVTALSGREEPSLNLPAPMVNTWTRGRSQPVTVIGTTQAPVNAPGAMYDQPQHLYLGRITDTYRQERLSEIGGDTKLIRGVLPQLKGREFLYIYKATGDEEEPGLWIVRAPRRPTGSAAWWEASAA